MSKKHEKRRIRRTILHFLQNNGERAFQPKALARKLGHDQPPAEYRMFREVVQDLKSKQEVRVIKNNRIQHRHKQRATIEGIFRTDRRGYGYVRVEDREHPIPIWRDRINGAIQGDRVAVAMMKRRGAGGKRYGEVVKVLDRAREEVIGTYRVTGMNGFVEPDESRLGMRIYIPPKKRSTAKDGDKVAAVVEKHDPHSGYYHAHITAVLGDADDPRVQMDALIRSASLPTAFPEEALAEAEALPAAITQDEVARRLDLRSYPIFTIDPDDARDFDDAIHVVPHKDGTVEIGIHIADVSHFVQQGGAVDQEAHDRATSVYLVDRVLPMLPERLSNNLCSLRPHEDRLAYSCLIRLDGKGAILETAFRETVIHSQARFTYDDAQSLLDDPAASHPLADAVRLAGQLAEHQRLLRFEQGSLDFERPEVKVRLDDAGHPVAIEKKRMKAANRLIEEFMLMANRAVAAYFTSLNRKGRLEKEGKPGIYRVHPHPDTDQLHKLARYVKTFGINLKLSSEGRLKAQDLRNLLQQSKGLKAEAIIKLATLRAMTKAMYAPHNEGHFGLAFTDYTHFTSPIRRYPDLVAHRLLKRYLAGGDGVSLGKLEGDSKHYSARERRAEEAERNSVQLKQIAFAANHVGETFDGLITNATKFGLFVEIGEFMVEGLVHIRELGDDYYEYDDAQYALVGSHTGKAFRPGDEVRVQIVRADPLARELDLLFA